MLKNDNFIFPPWIGSPDVPHIFIKMGTGCRFLFFSFIFFLMPLSKSNTLALSELINQLRCPNIVQVVLKCCLCFIRTECVVFGLRDSSWGSQQPEWL